jgi:mono/diheme cytochrome c family protein
MNTVTSDRSASRRRLLPLAVPATLALLISACSLLDPSPEATVSRPGVADCNDVPTLRDGSVIYRCLCVGCHGFDGVPNSADIDTIAGFDVRAKFDAALEQGPGEMPAFPELDAEQRDRLFAYVRDSLGL